MKWYTLHTFWNTNQVYSDILIFLPHSADDCGMIDFIRSSFVWGYDISNPILSRYIQHEADRWSREVAFSAIDRFFSDPSNADFKISIFEVHIPRGFCDLNRPWELACPSVVDNTYWKQYYDTIVDTVFTVLQSAKFCLQLHTMASYEMISSWELDRSKDEKDIEYFLTSIYSGACRECNILTRTPDERELTCSEFDTILSHSFSKQQITLLRDISYRLIENRPSTDITKFLPSSFLEITKWSLATDETKESYDTSKIILSPTKVRLYGDILADSFQEYLSKFIHNNIWPSFITK